MSEKDFKKLLEEFEKLVDAFEGIKVSGPSLNKLRSGLEVVSQKLNRALNEVDSVKNVYSLFDPSNPNVMGRFIAIVLLAQERKPLNELDRFYGSGVYALYYKGTSDIYDPISNKEHPIYVGKADPQKATAVTPVEQGLKLSGRLGEHSKNIDKADNLNLSDFDYRFLVVQSGWQNAAESYLIDLFKPIWNSEVKICYGFGKHGDSSKTRANKRSPWDTLHIGREWAKDAVLVDAFKIEEIEENINKHFATVTPYENIHKIFERFIEEMKQ